MRLSKKIWLTLFSTSIISPLSIISCQSTNYNDNDIEQMMKTELSNFVKTKKSLFDISKISINSNYIPIPKNDIFSNDYKNETANKINMFKILLNEDWKYDTKNEYNINDVFIIKQDEELTFHDQNFKIDFSFDYIKADSFGNNSKPYLNSDKNSIIIPALITLTNNKTTKKVSMFCDFFSLNIIDVNEVNNYIDLGYNGQKGKAILFENKDIKIKFQDIPNSMIDSYLDFNLIGKYPKYYAVEVRYPNSSNYDFSKWKNKTFTEVKNLSNVIQSPNERIINNRTYSYNILESSFDQNQRQYARFTIEFKIKDQSNLILIEANKQYGLIYYKKYTYVDRRWEFKLPSNEDIESFKGKNTTIATDLANEAKNIVNIFLPNVNFTPLDVNDKGIDEIISRFAKNKKEFTPASSFDYVILGDDIRKVWFEIESIEKALENSTDQIKVNIKLNVGEKDLQGSSNFSKIFNISTWKWSN